MQRRRPACTGSARGVCVVLQMAECAAMGYCVKPPAAPGDPHHSCEGKCPLQSSRLCFSRPAAPRSSAQPTEPVQEGHELAAGRPAAGHHAAGLRPDGCPRSPGTCWVKRAGCGGACASALGSVAPPPLLRRLVPPPPKPPLVRRLVPVALHASPPPPEPLLARPLPLLARSLAGRGGPRRPHRLLHLVILQGCCCAGGQRLAAALPRCPRSVRELPPYPSERKRNGWGRRA